MAIVDERGRLFGKINIIDLALLVLVAVLLPLGYGAYMLFRTPPPKVIAVDPKSVVSEPGVEQRMRVVGEHLRPFLKASLGKLPTRAFLVESPQNAEIHFIDVAPGTYDLVLFDEAEEVARFPNGVTIAVPPPPPPPPLFTLQLLGAFMGESGSTRDLSAGRAFGPADRPVATILALGEAEPDVKRIQIGNSLMLATMVKMERRSASLRAGCDTTKDACNVGGATVGVGTVINLPDPKGPRLFMIDEVRSDSPYMSELTVQLMGMPEILALVRPGDVDRPAGAGAMRGAVVNAVEASRTTTGYVALGQGVSAGDVSVSLGGQLPQPLALRIARIRLPVEPGLLGWKYRNVIIRTGGVISLETAGYSVRGLILSMTKPASTVAAREQS